MTTTTFQPWLNFRPSPLLSDSYVGIYADFSTVLEKENVQKLASWILMEVIRSTGTGVNVRGPQQREQGRRRVLLLKALETKSGQRKLLESRRTRLTDHEGELR